MNGEIRLLKSITQLKHPFDDRLALLRDGKLVQILESVAGFLIFEKILKQLLRGHIAFYLFLFFLNCCLLC